MALRLIFPSKVKGFVGTLWGLLIGTGFCCAIALSILDRYNDIQILFSFTGSVSLPLGIYFILRSFENYRPSPGRILKKARVFRWFLHKKTRESFDLTIKSLRSDAKEMETEKVPTKIIWLAISWGLLRSVMPILWDNAMRILKEVGGAAESIRKIVGRG
jgi:hypothetical protein